jgi:hypothetical protein
MCPFMKRTPCSLKGGKGALFRLPVPKLGKRLNANPEEDVNTQSEPPYLPEVLQSFPP